MCALSTGSWLGSQKKNHFSFGSGKKKSLLLSLIEKKKKIAIKCDDLNAPPGEPHSFLTANLLEPRWSSCTWVAVGDPPKKKKRWKVKLERSTPMCDCVCVFSYKSVFESCCWRWGLWLHLIQISLCYPGKSPSFRGVKLVLRRGGQFCSDLSLSGGELLIHAAETKGHRALRFHGTPPPPTITLRDGRALNAGFYWWKWLTVFGLFHLSCPRRKSSESHVENSGL